MMKNYMKKVVAVLVTSLLLTDVWAQTVTIPAANTNTASNRKPYGCFFGFERTAAIYTSAEIGSSGTITDLAYFVNAAPSSPAANTPVMIYMKQTASTTMVASTVATEETGATLVYSGSLPSSLFVNGTWANITLTTPFAYSTASNLEIIVEANFTGGGGEGSTSKQFRWSTSTTGATQTWQQDNTAPTGTGTVSSTTRPNITLIMTPASACTGMPTAGTASASPLSACGSGSFNLSLTGTTSASGITYQWQSSSVSGGPYTNVPGGTSASLSTGSISSTTYYVCVVTCTNSSQSATTNQVTATVFPAAVIGVTPTSSTLCQGGAPVALAATGGNTYTWGPAAGLSATTGANVTASPGAATTYTVTGTDGNGCTGTATATINVVEIPSVASVTAIPSSVCNGGNSQLAAVAGTTSAYTQTAATFGPIASGSGTVVYASAGTAVTPLTTGSLDDGYWNNQALPFTFNFYGAAYSTFNIQTNGAVSFTNFPTTTGYPQTLPSAATPNNMIAACFGDLDWRFGGVISTYVVGSAPNRVFVINYNGTTNGGFYNGGLTPTVLTTFQIQLFETSNVIQIHSNIAGTTTVAHSQGIENAGGTAAVPVTGRNNTTTWTTTNDAVQFVPTGGSLTYSWSPATFLSSPTVDNPMANGITSTTSWTVTVTNSGCSASGSVTVTAGSALTSSGSIAPANSVCVGTNITLSTTPAGGGAPYTYSWTGPNSFTSTLQNPTRSSVTLADAGTYTCIITDQCAATATVTVTLAVNGLPSVSVTPTTATFCSGGPGVALAATGASTYSWGPAAGLSATTGSNVTASPTATVTYTVTGTDGNGCVNNATAAITYAPGITGAAVVATPTAVCVGSSVSLNATSNGLPTTVFSENFNAGAPAWTRTNTSTGGTPANAAWTDRPDGFVYAGGTPYHSNDNSGFVQTNSDAQGSGSTTRTTLESPSFSTVGATNLTVDWFQFYRDIADPGDSAVFEASLDGINWTRITQFTATTGSEAAFTHPSVALPATYENQATVYIRFRYIGTWDWYWSLDNVTVMGMNNTGITYAWTASPAGFTSSIQSPTDNPTTATTYSVVMTTPAGCTASASTPVTVNALPTVTANATSTTVCAGTQVTFTGSGATSYTWTGGVTDNVAFTPATTDTYTVTGTDANGCTDTDNITVTVNALPTVVANTTASAVCTGSPVTLTGSGATSYTWTGAVTDNVAFTPVVTDTYTVTGTDANGCTGTDNVTVTVNALPTVTANATSTLVCAGTPVTFTGSGATSYTWTGGVTDNVAFTPATTDTYTVTGTDANGCTDTDNITVTVNALPTVTANTTASAVCAGSPVTLTGGGATSYTWTGGVTDNVAFTPATTDTYTVTGTDANGCMDTASVAVTVNAIPTVTVSLPLDTVCLTMGSVTLSGESPAGGTWSGSGVSGNTFDPTVPGVGMVAIMYDFTDVNGCTGSAIDSVVVDVCNGIEVNETGNAVLYPNPNNGDFTLIPAGSGLVDVMIYSATGQLVSAEKATAGQPNKINIAASGMYSVVVVTADGHRTTQRVIINR